MRTLIGSTFPLSLIRRRVVIEPGAIEDLRACLAAAPPASFWGHRNTLAQASALTGVDLTPRTERPAIELDHEGFPGLEGETFRACWVLSPDYVPGFRPAIGEEVPAAKIRGWQVLRVSWEEEGGA